MKSLLAFLLFFTLASTPVWSTSFGRNYVHSVKMERTPCLGTCPWYEVQIFEDGKVTYFGKKGAPRQGYFEGRINKDEAQALLYEFEKQKIHLAQNQYNKNVSDVPMLNYTFTLGKDLEKKVVKQANFGPGFLIDFAKNIDSLLANVDWKAAVNEDQE